MLAPWGFDPSGTRLYSSSQRNPGATYEITGRHGSQSGGAARVSQERNASVTATFEGEVLRWIGQRGPGRASAEVTIDGVLWARVDTYGPTYRSQQVLFATAELAKGVHRFEIRHAGANPAALGVPALVVDAVEASALR